MGRLSAFLLLCFLVECVRIFAETLPANPQCAQTCCHNDDVLFKAKPDCTIIHKTTEILAHRAILAASIPYFRDAFENNPSEMIPVELSADLDLGAIQCLVNFAYKQAVRIHSRNVEGLLRAARYLRVSNVMDSCTTFITSRFTPDSVIGTLNMAHLGQFPALRSKAEEYAHRHFYNMSQTESIVDLNTDAFVNLICSNDLNLSSEEPVFEVAIRWLKFKPDVRSTMTWDILKHVRYALLSKHYLTTRVQTENLVRNSSSVGPLIKEAILYDPTQDTHLTGCRSWPRNGTARFIALGVADNRLQFIDPTDKQNQRSIRTNLKLNYGAVVHQCHIYMFGGVERQRFVERYHPRTNTWELLDSLKNVTRRYPAVASMNQRLYVSGGYYKFESPLNTVECYDPNTSNFSTVASMLEPRVEHQLIVFEDSLYALGGRRDDLENTLNSVERFDAIRNKWTLETPMLVERRAMGVAEMNGKLYACGGYRKNTYLRSAEVFDPVHRTWKLISPMSVGRKSFSLLAYNGKLYAVGSLIDVLISISLDVYDPESNTWELREDYLAHPAEATTVMMYM